MWEEDFSNLDPSWSAHADVGHWGGGGFWGGGGVYSRESWQDYTLSCAHGLVVGGFTEKVGGNGAEVGEDQRSASFSNTRRCCQTEELGQT